MLNQLKIIILPLIILGLNACGGGTGTGVTDTGASITGSTSSTSGATIDSNAALLGKQLFSDKSLSFDQTLSCASCHNPNKGFIDDRDNSVASAVSVGDDQVSLGNRNSPTVSYASLTPNFSGNDQNATGGAIINAI